MCFWKLCLPKDRVDRDNSKNEETFHVSMASAVPAMDDLYTVSNYINKFKYYANPELSVFDAILNDLFLAS